MPGRFKDYIAIPKPNLYQSLHTTVIGPRGERIEVQIRTEGDAPHRRGGHRRALGLQGEGADGKGAESRRRTQRASRWLRQLVEWQQELNDPQEFLETVKVDLFTDEVFVFTPKGDVKSLPRGATPVDFAYAIHSEVGEHCVGAKVNGKLVPLRYKLKNGDTVEILTSPHAHPSKDWLTFVKTSRAQAAHPRVHPAAGRAPAARSRSAATSPSASSAASALTLNKLQKGGELEKAAQALGYRAGDDLLAAIGYGKVAPARSPAAPAAGEARREPRAAASAGADARGSPRSSGKVARRPVGGVRINGIDDVLVRFGRCCNPVPGDPIVGFITRGRGVTVHTVACDKSLGIDPERRVDVAWDVKGDFKRQVSLRVITTRPPGHPREDLADLQRGGREHLAGELPHDAGRARGERLRGHHRRPEAAQLGHPHLQRIDGVQSVERA